jgi:hypothetical protein
MSEGNVTSGARLIKHGRSSSGVLPIVIACLAMAAGGLSAGVAEAGPTTPASTTSCLVGTGTPVSAAATPDGPGCQSPSAALPTNVPRPVAGQPGARPTQEAPPSAESETNLTSEGVTPLTSGVQELYWYSLVTSHENCWQAGEPKESSYACDSVGSSYLPSHLVEGALDGDVALTRSGDYCNYYTIGQGLDTTDATKESEYTGYEPPSPLASYQEANHYRSVCQAHETFWGHEVRGANGSECTGTGAPCGMQHYVSLSEQKLNDLPWSSSLGSPILIISTEADPYTYTTGTHFGAWGYICPLFEDDTTGDILEFCMEEWRAGKGEPGTEEHFDVTAACAAADGHIADQTITQFALGTAFATEKAGSTNTFAFTGKNGGWKHFIAGITKGNLEAAINTTNSTCKGSYSTNPANYALIGIEDGTEGGGYGELGASEGNLQLWTEYTELPPTATTGTATGVQEEDVQEAGATLTGTVNPNAVETHYYFEYGTTTAYEDGDVPAAPGTDAGSGTAAVAASAAISGLSGGTTYHYRIVATNTNGETSYGADKTLETPLEPFTHMEIVNGTTETVLEGPNHSLVQHWSTPEGWKTFTIAGEGTTYSSPEFVVNHGTTEIFVQGPNHTLWQYWATAEGWKKFQVTGTNEVYSNPVLQEISGTTELVVQGPNHSLVQHWSTPEGWKTFTIAGEGTTYSSPEFVVNHGTTEIFVQGPNHTLWQYWATAEGWKKFQVTGTNEVYSNPVLQEISGTTELVVQGPNHSLVQHWSTPEGWKTFTIAGEGTTYSSPQFTVDNGICEIFVQGPSHTLMQYWSTSEGWKKFQVTSTNEVYSNPVLQVMPNGSPEVYVEGPNNTFVQHWETEAGWGIFTVANDAFA